VGQSPASNHSIRPKIEIHDDKGTGPMVQLDLYGHKVDALLDTGATASIITPELFNTIPAAKRPPVLAAPKTVTVANGNVIPTMGQAIIRIKINQQICISHAFLIVQMNIPLVLGYDLFKHYNCQLDFSNQTLNITNLENLNSNTCQPQAISVRATETTHVPKDMEVIIPASRSDKNPDIRCGVQILEPGTSMTVKQNIMVARIIVTTEQNLPVRVANLSGKDQVIHKGTLLGHLEPAAVIDRWEEPDWLDNSSNNNTETNRWSDAVNHLSPEQQTEAIKLLEDHKDVFAKNKRDVGRTGLYRHQVDTGDARPIKQPPRRFPPAKRQAADEELQRMLDLGIIRPSASPWSSPVVLVEKPDKSLRVCLDYRRLNQVTKKDSYPLPRIDDTLDTLGGSAWFSTLDLAAGFWQVEMEEKDIEKTAFATENGLWEFTVMPMGMVNSGATFQRLMQMVFKGLDWRVLLIYLDDLIVHSKTFDQHLSDLRNVLNRLKEAGLKLSPSKCQLFRQEVTFLGHIISPEGVRTDPKKTKAVEEWPIPQSVRDVRSYLGLVSYFRRHIKDFAATATPLHGLTKKGIEFKWSDSCQVAFDTLKQKLVQAPILAFPRDEGEFVLDTDASGTALGAVLNQIQGGEEKTILYFSRSLSRAERNYCVTRRELLAVIEAIKHCHHYLWGRDFLIRSDHGALRWITNFKRPEGQLARWIEFLGNYTFEIKHRAGTKHGNADGMSRRPCEADGCNQCTRKEIMEQQACLRMVTRSQTKKKQQKDAKPNPEDTKNLEKLWVEAISKAELQQLQEEDEDLNLVRKWVNTGVKPPWSAVRRLSDEKIILWTLWSQLHMVNGLLMRKQGKSQDLRDYRVIAPYALRQRILSLLHDTRMGGHQGVVRTTALVSARFWWPRMKRDVERWCKYCHKCQQRKTGPNWHAPLQQSIPDRPMARIAMDILSFPVPTRRGNVCILVVSDYFTKWSRAFALPDQQAYTIADVLVTEFFLLCGIPLVIHTDQGRQFQSDLIKELNRLLEIKQTRTTPYRPQSDGQVERLNRSLIQMLSKFVNKETDDWDEHLPYVMAAYNATIHASTGCSPNLLMWGRETTLPIDLMFDVEPFSPEGLCQTKYVEWVQQALRQNFDFAKQQLGKAAERQKRGYDQRAVVKTFKEGDWVMRLYPPYRHNKLNPHYTGPYRVLRQVGEVNYEIEIGRKRIPSVVHVDQLKKYYGDNWPGQRLGEWNN